MRCPMCSGKGMVDYPMYADDEHKWQYCVARMKKCDMCNGTGEVQMTNEEYLKSLGTEQLAEWLRGVYWHCHEIDCEHCNYPWRCMEKGDIVKWLKRPHKED